MSIYFSLAVQICLYSLHVFDLHVCTSSFNFYVSAFQISEQKLIIIHQQSFIQQIQEQNRELRAIIEGLMGAEVTCCILYCFKIVLKSFTSLHVILN